MKKFKDKHQQQPIMVQDNLPNFLKAEAEARESDLDRLGYVSHEYVKIAGRVSKHPAWNKYRIGLQKFLARNR